MARETHLEAIAAAIYAGHLVDTPDVREAAEAAAAAPAAPQPPRAIDLLLDGLAIRFVDGYPAGVPPLRKALDAFRHVDGVDGSRRALAVAGLPRGPESLGRRGLV